MSSKPATRSRSDNIRRRHIMPREALPWFALLLLTGCAANTRVTAAPTPSPTPQPVQITLVVTQQGAGDTRILKLATKITLTNHLDQTIGIPDNLGFVPPYVRFFIYTPDGTEMWDNGFASSGACDFGGCQTSDVATVAPGATQTWTPLIDTSTEPAYYVHGFGFQVGAKYRAVATIFWHIGPLSNDPEQGMPAASGQAQFTLT